MPPRASQAISTRKATPLSARSSGDDKDPSAMSIALTGGGGIALTGRVSGRVDLGADNQDKAGVFP